MSGKRMDDFRLIWLRSFLAVVEHNSFSKAAVALKCNQSTVSRNVGRLQIWLGASLFDYTSPVQLSDYGKMFHDAGAQVLDMLESRRTGQQLDRVFEAKPSTIKRQVIKKDAD